MRSASAFLSRSASAPRANASSAATSMPYATASPWRYRRYFVTASIAWPAVWPKFRIRRGPASRSSAETTLALMRHDSAMTGVSAAGSRAKIAVRSRVTRSKSPALDVTPYLIDLVEPRPELAPRQRAEHRRIDDDRVRLIERADQVLAERMIDADLAADGAVDLREQRRRHVNERDAPQVGGRGEAGHVADDAAAEGDERGRAIGVRANERVVDADDRRQLLVTLAVGDEDRLGALDGARDARPVQPPHQRARHDEAPLRARGLRRGSPRGDRWRCRSIVTV